MNIGSYWYGDKEKHRSVEFGVVLEFMDGYEVKHPSGKMTRELADCEAMKIICNLICTALEGKLS